MTQGANRVQFGYTYWDNENTIRKKTFDHRSGSPYNDYTYDSFDRLTAAAYHNSDTEGFVMDDLGNRDGNQTLRGDGTVHFAVDPLTNRYTAIAGHPLAYDAAGNLTQDKDGYQFTYDYENRIVEVRNSSNALVAGFDYDTQGRRIRVYDAVADATTLYYYSDNWQVLAEYNGSGIQQAYYVFGNYIDEVLLMNRGGSDKYYLHDHLYSPIALVNGSGSVIERYEYNAYGKAQVLSPNHEPRLASLHRNPYMFTGRELDILDGGAYEKMYYRHRDYDIFTGRFYVQDMKGISPPKRTMNYFKVFRQYKDGLSLYNYVENNPNISVDPFGLGLVIIGPDMIENPPIRLPIFIPIILPPNSGSEQKGVNNCQRCGPDITDPLVSLLRQVVENYTTFQKIKGCVRLNSFSGWDILTLWDRNYDGNKDTDPKFNKLHRFAIGHYDMWVPGFKSVYGCPTKDADPKKNCYGSVAVGGKCYKASAVNYVLYGTANRLCYEFLTDLDPDGAIGESEYYEKMIGLIMAYKKVIYKENLNDMLETLEWAGSGWFHLDEGANLMDILPKSREFSHCMTDCPSCEKWIDFVYSWDGTPDNKYPRTPW